MREGIQNNTGVMVNMELINESSSFLAGMYKLGQARTVDTCRDWLRLNNDSWPAVVHCRFYQPLALILPIRDEQQWLVKQNTWKTQNMQHCNFFSSFSRRFKMSWNYRGNKTNTFGTLKNVLCREVYYIMSLSWRVLFGGFAVHSHCSVYH